MKHQRSAVLAACGTKNAAFLELPINLCICVSCVQNSLSTNQFESILRLIRLVIMFFTKLRVCRFFFQWSLGRPGKYGAKLKIGLMQPTYFVCLFVWFEQCALACTCIVYAYCICFYLCLTVLWPRRNEQCINVWNSSESLD